MSYSTYRSRASRFSVGESVKEISREDGASSWFVSMSPPHRLCFVLLAVGVVLATFTGYLLIPQDKSPWLLPTLALYAGLLCIPFLFYQQPFGWFHPLVFTAILNILGLVRKSSAYIYGLSEHQAMPAVDPVRLNELVVYELGLQALGITCYYIGYHLIREGKGLKFPFPKPTARMEYTAAAFVGLSFAVFMAYMLSKGGLSAHISDWSHRSVKMDGEGFWSPFTSAGSVACLYWLAADRGALRSPFFWGSSVVALAVNFLTTGGRSHLIFFLFFAAMIIMLRARRIYFLQILAIGGVTLVLLGILGNFRRSTWKGEADWTTITQFNPFEAATEDATSELVRRSSSSSPSLAILERVPREVPFLFGSSYVGLVAFPIPKALWPGKPQGIHSLTGETFFGLIAGTPPGMVGEAYWNFYIPGVMAVFLLFGMFHRRLASFYLNNGDRPAALVLFVVTLYCLQGDSGTLVYLINILLPMALILPAFALSQKRQQDT